MNNQLTYQDHSLQVITHNGQKWLRAEDIGKVLEMKDPRPSVQSLYRKHRDEFTDEMSTVAKIATVDGKERFVRLFSARGAWLLGTFARTKKAKDFRVWVLDQLEGQSNMQSLRDQIHVAQQLLLMQKPRWNRIQRLRELGWSDMAIRTILPIPSMQFLNETSLMAKIGLSDDAGKKLGGKHHG